METYAHLTANYPAEMQTLGILLLLASFLTLHIGTRNRDRRRAKEEASWAFMEKQTAWLWVLLFCWASGLWPRPALCSTLLSLFCRCSSGSK